MILNYFGISNHNCVRCFATRLAWKLPKVTIDQYYYASTSNTISLHYYSIMSVNLLGDHLCFKPILGYQIITTLFCYKVGLKAFKRQWKKNPIILDSFVKNKCSFFSEALGHLGAHDGRTGVLGGDGRGRRRRVRRPRRIGDAEGHVETRLGGARRRAEHVVLALRRRVRVHRRQPVVLDRSGARRHLVGSSVAAVSFSPSPTTFVFCFVCFFLFSMCRSRFRITHRNVTVDQPWVLHGFLGFFFQVESFFFRVLPGFTCLFVCSISL